MHQAAVLGEQNPEQADRRGGVQTAARVRAGVAGAVRQTEPGHVVCEHRQMPVGQGGHRLLRQHQGLHQEGVNPVDLEKVLHQLRLCLPVRQEKSQQKNQLLLIQDPPSQSIQKVSGV